MLSRPPAPFTSLRDHDEFDAPDAAARRLAYRRLAAAILRLDIHSLTDDLQLQRRVIGRTPAGLPRTYRLVRGHRSWRTRLLHAMTA